MIIRFLCRYMAASYHIYMAAQLDRSAGWRSATRDGRRSSLHFLLLLLLFLDRHYGSLDGLLITLLSQKKRSGRRHSWAIFFSGWQFLLSGIQRTVHLLFSVWFKSIDVHTFEEIYKYLPIKFRLTKFGICVRSERFPFSGLDPWKLLSVWGVSLYGVFELNTVHNAVHI